MKKLSTALQIIDNKLDNLTVYESERMQKALELIKILKPTFTKHNEQFCFIYGDNMDEGLCGFGETTAEAAVDFYTNFYLG